MVRSENKFQTTSGKWIVLKQVLNCKDSGIYAGQCRICHELYIGQTMTSFNTRWNQHRDAWKKGKCGTVKKKEGLSDDQALYSHFSKYHPEALKGCKFSDAYSVIFIENPNKERLDIAESYWIQKTNAQINIMKTILPKVRITT